MLVLHGTADRVTNPAGSAQLERLARSADKTLKTYDGFFHDLLHEPTPSTVSVDIRDWLGARASPIGDPPPAAPS